MADTRGAMALLIALALAGCATSGERAAFTRPEPGRIPVLYVIGDSTAAAYPPARYPLQGWAQALPVYLDSERIQVENRAISGRSAKSFLDEGAWAPIRAALQPGDVVFIQFGHNDQKRDDPKRHTDPDTTYREYLRHYIDETRAAGANPVLLTSIHRNAWEGGRLRDSHGAYPEAVRALARDADVPLIDLHARTGRLFSALGPERTTRLFINLPPGLYPNYPEGKPDNTHLTPQGAHAISQLAARAMVEQGLPWRHAVKPGYAATTNDTGFPK